MSLRRSLPAGVVDAAGAALGTFGVGVYAVRYLGADELGVYALCFVAFTLANIVPNRGWFLPAEVRLLELPDGARIQGFRLTMAVGARVALLASPITALAWIPLAGEDPAVVGPLVLTAGCATLVSPIQDHVRRLMHLGVRSWLAAAISGVQVVAVFAALGAALALDVPHVWVPFGALVAANVVSTATGVALGLRYGHRPARRRYRLADAARSGRWLVAIALIPVGTTFLTGSIVVLAADSATLGLAEAARIAANPYFVFMTGVAGVINPRSMAAGAALDTAAVRRLNRVVDSISWLVLVPAVAVLGFDWPGNPMAVLVPRAYESAGLVLVSAVALLPNAMVLPRFAALLGAGREPALARANLTAGGAKVLVALSVFAVGEFAVPLAALTYMLVAVGGYRAAWRRHAAAAGAALAASPPAAHRHHS